MTSTFRASDQPSVPAVQTAAGEGTDGPAPDTERSLAGVGLDGIRAVVGGAGDAPQLIAVVPGREPEIRAGRCQCGDIAYEATGSPDDPHLCSCAHDTRISGGPAVLWVGFRRETLTWTGPGGEPTWYSTWPSLHRGFCPRCGTHLVSVADDSEMIMVTGFSLDDQRGVEPVGHSFREAAAA
jgi:hypothetical protein